MTEKEAVEAFLPDGSSFTMGGFLFGRKCVSVIREIVRQRKKDLTYIDTAIAFEPPMLVAPGCVRKLQTGYLVMRTAGIKIDATVMHAIKEGTLEIEDYTQFQMAMGFMAASLNIPYMVTKSGLGTDIPKYNKTLKVINDPVENKPLILVPAIRPDVGFFSVQRADRRGNAQIFGELWADDVKSRACKHVVVITEELVSTEVIHKYPGNTLIPSYCVDAVVELPFNCHPWSSYGCYHIDWVCFLSYLVACGTRDGALKWVDEWIYGTKDHFEYCDKVGWKNLMRLAKMEKSINRLPE
jgi:glutaconate CoA-transferase subunit A